MSVKRKAVLVGIDRYQLPGATLQGCENDCKDMGATLRILGFPSTRIHYLTNEQATKANIAKQLSWLTTDMNDGDIAVYYHSSHGTGVTDVNNDEADEIDELAVTHDFDWWDENTWLTDDDFYNYFTNKMSAGVRTDVIFDTCYSGTMTKTVIPVAVSDYQSTATRLDIIRESRKSRYLVPPLSIRQQVLRLKPAQTKFNYIGDSVLGAVPEDGTAPSGSRTTRPADSRVVDKFQDNSLFSACQDYQVSWELDMGDGEVRGAFTYIFCKILRRSNGNLTRNELYNGTRQWLFDNGFEQVPDLALPDAFPQAGDMAPFRKASEADTLAELERIRSNK